MACPRQLAKQQRGRKEPRCPSLPTCQGMKKCYPEILRRRRERKAERQRRKQMRTRTKSPEWHDGPPHRFYRRPNMKVRRTSFTRPSGRAHLWRGLQTPPPLGFQCSYACFEHSQQVFTWCPMDVPLLRALITTLSSKALPAKTYRVRRAYAKDMYAR